MRLCVPAEGGAGEVVGQALALPDLPEVEARLVGEHDQGQLFVRRDQVANLGPADLAPPLNEAHVLSLMNSFVKDGYLFTIILRITL